MSEPDMNDIQKLLEEQRKQSQVHKISEGKINRTIANKQKATTVSFGKKMSEVKTGVKRPDMLGKNNIANTEVERKRRSELMKGIPKTKASRNKFKETYKNLDMIVCPHCGFESKNQGNMNRYHFDNCKHK